MIQPIEMNTDYVIGFCIQGKVNADAFGHTIERIDDVLANDEQVNLYVEVQRVGGITLKALWDDIRYGFRRFNDLRHGIRKVAIVTNKTWVRQLTKLENKLIPGIDERPFSFDEREQALAWVRG